MTARIQLRRQGQHALGQSAVRVRFAVVLQPQHRAADVGVAEDVASVGRQGVVRGEVPGNPRRVRVVCPAVGLLVLQEGAKRNRLPLYTQDEILKIL